MASRSGPSPKAHAQPAASLSTEADVTHDMDRYRPAVIEELRSVLDGRSGAPFSLMRYHLGWEDQQGRPTSGREGKLLRPALCLLCCEAAGGDWQRALPAAAALELLHNFTLIHDDVEDASPERHGRETLWSLWGQAQAINVGDGMFALAHLTLLRLRDRSHSPERVLEAARMLDDAALRLSEGQHLDLAYSERSEIARSDYLAMIEGKTAALLAASSGIGALLGDASTDAVDAFREFGRLTGLAFQIRDDVLGIWGSEKETGKPTSDDLRSGKKSYPVVVGLERASPQDRRSLQALLASTELDDEGVQRARVLLESLGTREDSESAAHQHAEAAIAALEGLSLRPKQRGELERLARFAAQRRS
jgi:geranylgeranyl diphosphate synthase type I